MAKISEAEFIKNYLQKQEVRLSRVLLSEEVSLYTKIAQQFYHQHVPEEVKNGRD